VKTLFLVEDNQDNADLICDLVGSEYRVVCFPEATSALAALTCHDRCRPDLFLLDISLPGMDGATLLRHIRACDGLETIPAVALTAHAMKADRDALLSAGFNAYLSKPITDDELLFATIKKQIPN